MKNIHPLSAVWFLIARPIRFIELSTWHDIDHEFQSNTQLLTTYPSQELPPDRVKNFEVNAAPLGMRYEETYARAYPFDKLVDDLFKPVMVEEAVNLIKDILKQGAVVFLIINNRAGGNAPMIAQNVAERFMGG